MHTWMVRNDCLYGNDFWVVTNLPPLEKSHRRDFKEAEVRKDIKVIWSRIHRSRILRLDKVTLRVEFSWTRVSLKGECIKHKLA